MQMNLPAYPPISCGITETLVQALGVHPVEVLAAEEYQAVFDSEAAVRAIVPNHALLSQLDLRDVIVTAPGVDVDYASRFLAPKPGVPEDPVTCSAHCALVPYRDGKPGKNTFHTRQVSRCGGVLTCEVTDRRVELSGGAVTFMEAEIAL